MTTESLSWQKAKDLIVIGIGTMLIIMLGYLATGLAKANDSLAEVKRDIAVILVIQARDKEEFSELKDRVAILEGRVQK